MAAHGYRQLDIDTIRYYVMDLQKLLDESEVAQRKAFLRSFVKKLIVDMDIVKLYYVVLVPPDGKRMETTRVLPINTPSGAGGIRTPYLLTASQTFSQVNYGPVHY
jgi:site-specific DNA recombinase